MKKKKEALEKALSEITLAIDDMYDTVCFDELGITRLFVDEAHNFKNVPFETKANKVAWNQWERLKKMPGHDGQGSYGTEEKMMEKESYSQPARLLQTQLQMPI